MTRVRLFVATKWLTPSAYVRQQAVTCHVIIKGWWLIWYRRGRVFTVSWTISTAYRYTLCNDRFWTHCREMPATDEQYREGTRRLLVEPSFTKLPWTILSPAQAGQRVICSRTFEGNLVRWATGFNVCQAYASCFGALKACCEAALVHIGKCVLNTLFRKYIDGLVSWRTRNGGTGAVRCARVTGTCLLAPGCGRK